MSFDRGQALMIKVMAVQSENSSCLELKVVFHYQKNGFDVIDFCWHNASFFFLLVLVCQINRNSAADKTSTITLGLAHQPSKICSLNSWKLQFYLQYCSARLSTLDAITTKENCKTLSLTLSNLGMFN